MSMEAQPQSIITNVAEIQPSRGKVSEPARLAGLHQFSVQIDNCQSKERTGAGIQQVGLGDGGQGREGKKQWWWTQGRGSRTVLFKRSKL